MTISVDPSSPLRIGIDVGGTNTDAVVLDEHDNIITCTKVSTTEDVTTGIRTALRQVVGDLGQAQRQIAAVMLGTTHAVNAIVQRRGLARVAAIRIGDGISAAVPPLTAWPQELTEATVTSSRVFAGGHLIDGHEVAPLDKAGLREFLTSVAGQVDAVAITSVFGPLFPEHELAARDIARECLGQEAPVSLGHELGAVGLLQRENATVLNAAVSEVANHVITSLNLAVQDVGLNLAPYFAQNDGTLMDSDTARRFPILTVGSGPSNSLRGAAMLSGVADAIVVDVGGTTTDLGILSNGFPRESTRLSAIGGVETNFPMPDIIALAYGGGTIIRGDAVGPDSVAHRLKEQALGYGGTTATLTDAAVALGRMDLGADFTALEERPDFVQALAQYDEALSEAVEALGSHSQRLPVIAVGGAARLVPDQLASGNEVIRIPHADVANAVGAAQAKIGSTLEAITPITARDATIAATVEQAISQAIAAGSDPRDTSVISITETPVAYSDEPTLKLKVKVAGSITLTVG